MFKDQFEIHFFLCDSSRSFQQDYDGENPFPITLKFFFDIFRDNRSKESPDWKLIEESTCSAYNITLIGRDNVGKTECIAAVSFVIVKTAGYINWFATSQLIFIKTRWIHGDDKAFQGRGIATFLFQIVRDIQLYFGISNPSIFLQVNQDDKAAISYYNNRGFVDNGGDLADEQLKSLLPVNIREYMELEPSPTWSIFLLDI